MTAERTEAGQAVGRGMLETDWSHNGRPPGAWVLKDPAVYQALDSIHPLAVGEADGDAFGQGLGSVGVCDYVIDAAAEQFQLQAFAVIRHRRDYHQSMVRRSCLSTEVGETVPQGVLMDYHRRVLSVGQFLYRLLGAMYATTVKAGVAQRLGYPLTSRPPAADQQDALYICVHHYLPVALATTVQGPCSPVWTTELRQ
jgi:hypothetical protein